jgi:hypothetical protein
MRLASTLIPNAGIRYPHYCPNQALDRRTETSYYPMQVIIPIRWESLDSVSYFDVSHCRNLSYLRNERRISAIRNPIQYAFAARTNAKQRIGCVASSVVMSGIMLSLQLIVPIGNSQIASSQHLDAPGPGDVNILTPSPAWDVGMIFAYSLSASAMSRAIWQRLQLHPTSCADSR